MCSSRSGLVTPRNKAVRELWRGSTPYALQANIATHVRRYPDFLDQWKNSDPDIPTLKEAKAEYAKLQTDFWMLLLASQGRSITQNPLTLTSVQISPPTSRPFSASSYR
jgi:hypothetical protein